jgi:hypothetical protein
MSDQLEPLVVPRFADDGLQAQGNAMLQESMASQRAVALLKQELAAAKSKVMKHTTAWLPASFYPVLSFCWLARSKEVRKARRY